MTAIKQIREKLRVTQVSLAQGIGVTQGNLSHYEKGQVMPPDVARRLIDFAAGLGVSLTFDDVYRQPTKEPANV